MPEDATLTNEDENIEQLGPQLVSSEKYLASQDGGQCRPEHNSQLKCDANTTSDLLRSYLAQVHWTHTAGCSIFETYKLINKLIISF